MPLFVHRKGHRDYWQDRLLDPETGLKMLNFSFLPPEWCTDVAQFTARLQGSPFYPNFADGENQVVNNYFYYTRMPPTKDVAALQTQQARAGVKHRDDIGRVASTQVESGGASSSSSASSSDTYQGLTAALQQVAASMDPNASKSKLSSDLRAAICIDLAPLTAWSKQEMKFSHQPKTTGEWPPGMSVAVQDVALAVPKGATIFLGKKFLSGPCDGFAWCQVDSLPPSGDARTVSPVGTQGLVLVTRPSQAREPMFEVASMYIAESATDDFYD